LLKKEESYYPLKDTTSNKDLLDSFNRKKNKTKFNKREIDGNRQSIEKIIMTSRSSRNRFGTEELKNPSITRSVKRDKRKEYTPSKRDSANKFPLLNNR
jgi:hypothetical protein